jgi:hypothetical protein
MKITSDLTNLTTAILILTVQMFIEWTLLIIQVRVAEASHAHVMKFLTLFVNCHFLSLFL